MHASSARRDSERTAMEYDAMGAACAAVNDEGSANAYYERPATIDLIGGTAPSFLFFRLVKRPSR